MDHKTEAVKRDKIRRFFGNRLNVRAQLQMLVGFLFLAGLSFLLNQPVMDGMGLIYSTIFGMLAAVPLTRIGIYYLRTRPPGEDEIHRLLAADWDAMAQVAAHKLRLSVGRYDKPFVLVGQMLDDTGRERTNIPRVTGKLGRPYYAANRIIVLIFTEHIIGAYICDLNSLEAHKDGILHESTFECYYRDIISFETHLHDPVAEALLANYTMQQFQLKPTHVTRWFDTATSILKNKYQRVVVRDFALVASNGQKIGTSIGVTRTWDAQGQSIQEDHDLDATLDLIQKMLREKKEQGSAINPWYVQTE